MASLATELFKIDFWMSGVAMMRYIPRSFRVEQVDGITVETWNRPEAAELAKLYGLVAPNYAAVMESYQKTQEVIKHPQTK